MNRMKKSLFSLLALSVVLAACGAKEEAAPTTPAESEGGTQTAGGTDAAPADPNELEYKSDTSPFTFRQYFYGTWASNYLWKDQYAMKLVTEKTGATIDRFLATGNDNDFLNTMIASNDLPDTLMLDWNHPQVTKLINSGMVYSLDELIDQYAPNFRGLLDEEMVKYHSVNGKLWYLPNFYETKDRLVNGVPITPIRPYFVRSDIYEALGQPAIETEEDLIAFLKDAKAKYPDLSPLGMESFDVSMWGFQGSLSMDSLIYSFSPNHQENRIKDDEKLLTYPMRDPGFIEAFRFVNRLQKEGLFDSQQLIAKQEQYEEKIYGGQYIVSSAFMNNIYTMYNPKIESTIGADKKYVILNPLKVDGQEPRYPAQRLMGWQGFFITKNAKNPDRIIKFLEYAWSDEGQMDLRYGTEGETYDMVDGLPQYKEEVKQLELSDNAAWYNKYGLTASTLMWRAGKLWDDAEKRDFMKNQPEQYAAKEMIAKYNFDGNALGLDNIEPEGSTTEGVINAKIKDLWNKTIPKLVLAKSDAEFDKVYADFIADMDKVGAAKVEKVMYERHIQDLQKKGVIQ
ncbi:extracellular solute-binding protein [Paenibacillus antri]|uniref:Extracellular solute-binding protein n=1 Tax=Paenibacillus antri TaxID=2582848 RepID=A0A5R9G286_9BACL|nr:extracellular solute-binding protein [Paenibacillus antri]TLS48260.1 extracellular solute-binding protein [Paenibacillus antri]